jgi:hypothetical protein
MEHELFFDEPEIEEPVVSVSDLFDEPETEEPVVSVSTLDATTEAKARKWLKETYGSQKKPLDIDNPDDVKSILLLVASDTNVPDYVQVFMQQVQSNILSFYAGKASSKKPVRRQATRGSKRQLLDRLLQLQDIMEKMQDAFAEILDRNTVPLPERKATYWKLASQLKNDFQKVIERIKEDE